MKFAGIIPARYASTRLPGKPLAMLAGKPLIRRVYEQVSGMLDQVCVATDDDRIYQAVAEFGGHVVMTSPFHRSGTDRVREAAAMVAPTADVIVNIQGDEPFIQRSQVETLCGCFDDPGTMIATLGRPYTDRDSPSDLEDPNTPKVVCDNEGFALYFSRSVIPYLRGVPRESWAGSSMFLRHIGIYAYRRDVLERITRLEPSPLEMAESLEQLRWLQNGYRIKVGLTDVETIGIDTIEDLRRAEEHLKGMESGFYL